MEETLDKTIKTAAQLKQTKVCEACYAAREVISNQVVLLQTPVYEVRELCIIVVTGCLENKNSKLTTLAVENLQRLLRDKLYWTVDTDNELNQLPLQMTTCISASISNQVEHVQADLLKVLLEMACTGPSAMTQASIEAILDICLQVVSVANLSNSVQTAAQATSSQSVECYVKYLVQNELIASNEGFELNLFPLSSWLCQKVIKLITGTIKEESNSSTVRQLSLMLKCISSSLVALNCDKSIINTKLLEFMWQTLCPLMIKLISSSDLKAINCVESNTSEQSSNVNYGRGSECLNSSELSAEQLKLVFNIGAQLIRLVGWVKSMRPVLESLFHRVLLVPPIASRGEALKYAREILKNPELVVKMSCPTLNWPDEQQPNKSNDFDLLRIFTDSLKECSYSSEASISQQSVLCITSLLSSLEQISFGQGFGDTFIAADIIDKIKTHVTSKVLASPDGHDINEAENNVHDNSVTSMSKDLKNFKINDYKQKLDELLTTINKRPSDQKIEDVSEKDDKRLDDGQSSDADVSSSTEGPESENEVDHEPMSESSETSTRLKKLLEVASYHERNRTTGQFAMAPTSIDPSDEVARKERENGRDFVKQLTEALSESLLLTKNSIEVDQALQEFASNYCKDVWNSQQDLLNNKTNELRDQLVIVNGDGIYLTIFSVLALNLKLIKSNYYANQTNSEINHVKPSVSEAEFVNDVQGSGLVVHLSATWLTEVYQQVLAFDLMTEAGYSSANFSSPLIKLVVDIDGLGDTQPGSQELSDYKKLSASGNTASFDAVADEVLAGRILVRKILTNFWSSMLTTLGSLFRNENDTNTNGLLALLADSDLHKDFEEKRQVLVQCLESLQVAARICIRLELQNRCNGIFDLLTKSVCPTDLNATTNSLSGGSRRMSLKRKLSLAKTVSLASSKKLEPFSLHVSQVLSMKAILSSALEIGSHCTPCWTFVFKCCEFIISIENNYFARTRPGMASKTKSAISSFLKSSGKSSKADDLDLSFGKVSESCDSMVSSMLGLDFHESDAAHALDTVIEECSADPSSRSVLKEKRLEKAIESLYQMVEKMFDESASRLNLSSLIGFLSALATCSRHELLLRRKQLSNESPSNKGSNPAVPNRAPLLFCRLCDLILRVSKSGRPLVHFLRCWSIVSPVLSEAACYNNDLVSKTAVSTINDVITVILTTHVELEHFNFNEGLFRPFETLLLLELCDSDIQEMIISSICGFVEGSSEDIRSGWRTLFGALRGIQLPTIPTECTAVDAYELEVERVRQLRVILDIFEAFLNVQNLQIFANAAVDCLLCLFRLLKDPDCDDGTDDFEHLERPPSSELVPNNSNSSETPSVDLCLVALKYIHQFESMLRSMYQMPACPLFSSTRRVTVCSEPKVIQRPPIAQSSGDFPLKVPLILNDLDRPVRILHVWFLLLDGLTNAIITCPRQHQTKAIEMSMALMGTLREVPSGLDFAVYSLNHIALPMTQRWLHELNAYFTLNASYFLAVETNQSIQFTNFKHFCGLISYFVVEHVKLMAKQDNQMVDSLNLLLTQTLLVFMEPLGGTYHESLFTLCSSCLRHVITGVAPVISSPDSWDIICNALDIVNKQCLKSLEQLNDGFPNKTVNFFDDLLRVKIVTKRDSTPRETQRLVALAQQLFSQKSETNGNGQRELFKESITSDGDDRSFVFHVEMDTDSSLEVSFRSLLYELNSHQLFIKTITVLLLQGSRHEMSNVTAACGDITRANGQSTALIDSLESRHLDRLLSLLNSSYDTFAAFDERPGLKFLLQKVSRLDVPAALYKQAALCLSAASLVSFHFVSNFKSLDNESTINRTNHMIRLTECVTQLCDKYSDFVAQNQRSNTRLDDLCQEPIFLMTTEVPFLEVIGRKNFDLKDIKKLLSPHSSQNSSPSKSSSSKNSHPDLDMKAYAIVSKERIDQIREDFKKAKMNHAPVPPDIIRKMDRKRNLPKRFSTTSDDSTNSSKANDICLGKDHELFVTIWTQLINDVFKLQLDLDDDVQFKQLIDCFGPGYELLILFIPDKQLRTTLTTWVRRIRKLATR